MKIINNFKLQIPAKSANESFARVAVGAFVSQLDPLIDEIADIKTAVSEAVTNCIVHAYKDVSGDIYISAKILSDNRVCIKIRDKGCGIADIEKAMEPLFTTGSDDRAGLGFAIMQSFCNSVKVVSKKNSGTTVTLVKKIIKKSNEP